MEKKVPNKSFWEEGWESIPQVKRYSHQAMATTFEVIVQHEDEFYARQAADAAFDELDLLEANLSRYIENSDISRLNNLPAGEPLQVGLDTFESLMLSRKMHEQTNGAFDITIGNLLACWRDEQKQPRRPGEEELAEAMKKTGTTLMNLDESSYSVVLKRDGLHVDLGGIGKGYALDKMAELLREWSIDRALIHGGFSTVLALDGPELSGGQEAKGDELGWPVTFSNPRNRGQRLAMLQLEGRSLSGSGLEKGQHIIDPRTGRPVKGVIAGWACAADGGTADALSTAFMIMKHEEIERYCAAHKDVLGLVITEKERDGKKEQQVRCYGRWKEGQLVGG